MNFYIKNIPNLAQQSLHYCSRNYCIDCSRFRCSSFSRNHCTSCSCLHSVTATNVDLSTEVGKEVHVGDWTTSTFGLVSYYPWRYKEFRVSSLDGKILVTSPATETEKSWVIYYHKDGRKTFSPNLSSSTYYWDIQNDSTIMYNGTTRKLQVNQEEMIISYEIIFEGEPAWFDMVFEHASDTPTDPD